MGVFGPNLKNRYLNLKKCKILRFNHIFRIQAVFPVCFCLFLLNGFMELVVTTQESGLNVTFMVVLQEILGCSQEGLTITRCLSTVLNQC